MKASILYGKLDADFILDGITDKDWALKMPELEKYLDADFRRRGMGLMCDFTEEITKVYTTVFLSEKVLSKVLEDDVTCALIFSHHPTNWGIEHHNGNYAADPTLIAKLKERKISIYVLHHPLDHYGDYSTCKTLAKALKIKIEEPAFLCCGAMCGVIGRTACKDAGELRRLYSRVVGHETSLYLYGEGKIGGEKIAGEKIAGEEIAVCPGGSNAMFVLDEMIDRGIKNLITGVTIVNDYSREAHRFAEEHHINVFGGTHYSSEKFALIKICEYFRGLGMPSEFICDTPDLCDL